VKIGAGVALIAAAVALALLGLAVLALPAGGAQPVRTQPAQGGVAARLLEHGDAFDEIVAIYRAAVELPAAAGDPRGPVRISQLIPKLRSSDERAQAYVMAGTLLAYSAGAGFGVVLPSRNQAPTQTVLGQAREDFRSAIRADPANEEAKYDLELLLRQQQVQSPRHERARPRKKTPTTQDARRKTAPNIGQEHHAGIYETGTGY